MGIENVLHSLQDAPERRAPTTTLRCYFEPGVLQPRASYQKATAPLQLILTIPVPLCSSVLNIETVKVTGSNPLNNILLTEQTFYDRHLGG